MKFFENSIKIPFENSIKMLLTHANSRLRNRIFFHSIIILPISHYCLHIVEFFTFFPVKIVGKMMDFETLTLCISVNKIQMCVSAYLSKDLVTEYCQYLVRNSIHNNHPFSN